MTVRGSKNGKNGKLYPPLPFLLTLAAEVTEVFLMPKVLQSLYSIDIVSM
jgi:hypothetical protein